MVKYSTRLMSTIVALAIFYLIFPRKAHAYLDPGTGSYILQMLIAALLGGLFAVKLFWNKIKTFFRNFFSNRQKGEEAEG